jgi:chemosensory pili system protein ChpA (sensor histidine kinase/response regulator)
MLTVEIVAVLALLATLVIYALVKTRLHEGEVAAGGSYGRNALVLIVDDDPDFVRITARILETHGYDTVAASNGTEALKMLHYLRERRPDVLLLDIMMDYVTDGLDLGSRMQRDPNLRDVPVVMITSVTGVSGQQIRPRDERLQARRWLTKPVSPEELLNTVEAVLASSPARIPATAPVTS